MSQTADAGRYSVTVGCGFCGEEKAPQGIDSHERFCDANPVTGMTYAEAEERGLLDDDAVHASQAGSEPSGDNADPDQGTEAPDGLPERQELPEGDKSTRRMTDSSDASEERRNCPSCGSDEVLSSEDARAELARENDSPDPDLLTLFSFADSYCEGCFALIGGKFEEPTRLTELVE